MIVMLTREAVGYIALFAGIFVVGLILGNFAILSVSMLPLFTVLLGLLVEQPGSIEIRMNPLGKPVWTGDVIELSSEVVIAGGVGEVSLVQTLPDCFEIVEGNNFRTFWKGPGERTFLFSYRVRCPKRGRYSLGPVEWESVHLLGLTRTNTGQASGTSLEFVVRPKILNVRRIRGVPAIATSASPVIDIAKIGVATTDFREIRSYVSGDSVRTINWKATARHAGRGTLWPLVNEYEVEGKKAVWVFLDASSELEIGTTIENAFEYSLEAASGVAYFYLDRGYRLGMYVYHDGNRLLYPDCGMKQFRRILGEVTELKPSSGGDSFSQAVDRCKRYILSYRPLCIVITSLNSTSHDSLVEGVKKIAVLGGRQRKRSQVMVVSVDGHSVVPRHGEYEDNAADLLRLETRPLVRSLRALGASVLEWSPKSESFGVALLRQVITR